MSRICPLMIRLFLAVTLILGGVLTHVGSVVHAAASSEFAVPHGHASPTEAKGVSFPAESSSIDLPEPQSDTDDPSHALGLCIDAHCCTPAVHLAGQDLVRHLLESDKLLLAAQPDYALSVAYSLLRPPRAIA
jgi:hypothetical protein